MKKYRRYTDRATTYNFRKMDWEIVNCPECNSSEYYMEIDGPLHSDEDDRAFYQCEDCGCDEPPD